MSIFAAWVLGALDPALAQQAPACVDFLAAASRNPPGLTFAACESATIGGTAALRATYRVAGAEAAKIEAYLIRRAHMPPLRYNCCGWETPPGGRLSFAGQQYQVEMTSGETIVSRRRDWRDIPYFTVDVVRYLD